MQHTTWLNCDQSVNHIEQYSPVTRQVRKTIWLNLHLVDLVEHADVIAELKRRTEHNDHRREHQVDIQTLQPSHAPHHSPTYQNGSD